MPKVVKVTRANAHTYPAMLIGLWLVVRNGVVIDAYATKREAIAKASA
jgi:hypothetical protein